MKRSNLLTTSKMKPVVLSLVCCLFLTASFPHRFKPILSASSSSFKSPIWVNIEPYQNHIGNNITQKAQIHTLLEYLKQHVDTAGCDSIVRLRWVNFSPYTKISQNPNNTNIVIPESQIIELLDSLRPYADGIRTFGTQHGLENVPRLAKERGFKVIVGIWLGSEGTSAGLAANKDQIANGIKIVKDSCADKVIVGSEVLYRNNLSPAQLVKYINEVKAVCQPLNIPVSCADVYYHLAAHPEVIAACDFVAPNIYPFWESVHIDEAMQRFHHGYQIVRAVAGNKKIFISESGWKTSGSSVGNAKSSLANALRYDRALLHWSKAMDVEVCLFEAFDEPWKLPNDDGWGIFFNNATLKPGMECLFAPITEIDTTWLCEKLIGNGPDTLAFDFVPVIGSSEYVRGHVNFVKPCDYMVALYIKVGSGWWTKPYYIPPFVPINSDGTWSTPYWTGGNDGAATDICAFLIPITFWPPIRNGQTTLPATIYQNAIASTCYHRYVLSPVSALANPDTICFGDTVTLTATGGSHYFWGTTDTTASIKVVPPYNGANTYRVTITDGAGGGAISTASVTVIKPPAIAKSDPSVVCPGEISTLTASGGIFYKWSTGDTSAIIQVKPDTTTIYMVTVTDASGCSAATSTKVSVVIVNAKITTSQDWVCKGKSINLYASGGSYFLWSTGQISNSIQVTPLQTEIYSVTVTTYQSGCMDTVMQKITVWELPSAEAYANLDTVCRGDTIMLTAKGGINYKWSNGKTTDTIYEAPTSTRTYYVTVMDSVGCSNTATVNVKVNSLPTVYKTTGGGAYCEGGSGVVIGLTDSESGVNYQLRVEDMNLGTPVTGTNSAISFGKKTKAGTYKVVATNKATGCTNLMADSAVVTVNLLPSAFNVMGGGAYCSGASGVEVVLAGSQSGISYQLKNGAENSGTPIIGDGSAISFGNQTMNGTYTVLATNSSTGCTNTMTGNVTIEIGLVPDAFNITGGGGYCFGGSGVEVALAGSQSSISYQLKNGSENLGASVIGTGSAISFGNQTIEGVYTVVATNITTSCTQIMADSAVVSVNQLPSAFKVKGGGKYCSGDSLGAEVALSGSQKGVEYQLKIGGTNHGAPVQGTDSVISFGFQTIEGIYTVLATNTSTGCTNIMTDNVIIEVALVPSAFNVSGGGGYCFGDSGTEVTLAGSQSDVSYQLMIGTENSGAPVIGTGSAISFGNQTMEGIYTVVATNITTGCTQIMSNSVEVLIYPLPIVNLLGLDSVYTNQDPPKGLVGIPPGGTYNGLGVSDSMIFYPAIAGIGQHTIYYSFTDSNGCTGKDSFIVNVVLSTKLPDGVNSILVFPKPNSGMFWMQLEMAEPKAVEISLIGPFGQVLLSQWEHPLSGQTMLYFEKASLPPGLYLLKLRTETGGVWVENLPICR